MSMQLMTLSVSYDEIFNRFSDDEEDDTDE